MKTVNHLPKAVVFEKYLREQGDLTIEWPKWRRVHDVNEDVDVDDYRLLLNGNEIGVYSEISEAGAWGRLRELRFNGRIPGYKSDTEEIRLTCITTWGRGYSNKRMDDHKEIPFHYSRN